MRRSMLFAVVSALSLLSLAAGSAKCQGPVSVAVKPHSNGRLVVLAKVNDKGPYPFLLDTGASMTILDSALFAELGIKTQGRVELASIKSESVQNLGIVDEISLDGLIVATVSVVTVKSLDIGPIHVRGVLGENFLSHFDLLIDNEHGRISLDPGDELMEEMTGERLPVTFDSKAGARGLKVRPTVSVTIQAFGATPLNLLLDSAADTVIVRASKNRQRTGPKRQSESKVTVHSVYGALSCASWEDELQWGTFRANGVRMTDCGRQGAAELGDEGSLPTSGFKQIFVSHSGGYVVLNPTRRMLVPERPTEEAITLGTE